VINDNNNVFEAQLGKPENAMSAHTVKEKQFESSHKKMSM